MNPNYPKYFEECLKSGKTPCKLYEKFTDDQLKIIANILHYYFNLVNVERIYKLIKQVDSIDWALHLLMVHKESEMTIDAILYEWLSRKDEK